jgi:AraC family transcriptional regulator, transcriptional activator of pobA
MKDIFPFYSIGHFINEPNNPTEFEITRFEEMEELDIEDPHKHTFYEIIWIDEGLSKQVIDYQEYEISPNTIFFISPNQLHHFEEWQPLKGGSIFFTEDFFLLNYQDKNKLFELTFLDNFYAKPYFQFDKDAFFEIKQVIDWIFIEKQRKDYSSQIIQSLLHILLSKIQRSIDSTTQTTVSKNYIIIYKKLKNLIDTHYREALTATDYAFKMNVSQHHLNVISNQVTGKTTSELIRNRRILEAKRLLTFTDNSVSEIAIGLGFFDLSYFAKVFKSETGLSPLDFRKSMSEKYRNL